MVTIIYNFEAVRGQADALIELLQNARDLGITVTGCEAYDVYQSNTNPYEIVMIERWVSVEAHQSFFEKTIKASGLFDNVIKLLVELPQASYYQLRTPRA